MHSSTRETNSSDLKEGGGRWSQNPLYYNANVFFYPHNSNSWWEIRDKSSC